jgi:hypothetical protein
LVAHPAERAVVVGDQGAVVEGDAHALIGGVAVGIGSVLLLPGVVPNADPIAVSADVCVPHLVAFSQIGVEGRLFAVLRGQGVQRSCEVTTCFPMARYVVAVGAVSGVGGMTCWADRVGRAGQGVGVAVAGPAASSPAVAIEQLATATMLQRDIDGYVFTSFLSGLQRADAGIFGGQGATRMTPWGS